MTMNIIIRTFQVSTEGESKKLHLSAEWDKENDPTKALAIDGHLSPNEISVETK